MRGLQIKKPKQDKHEESRSDILVTTSSLRGKDYETSDDKPAMTVTNNWKWKKINKQRSTQKQKFQIYRNNVRNMNTLYLDYSC